MNKRILMIYPEVPSSYWSFKYSLKFVNKKAAFPPLGLITVAAMLPEEFEIKLIDLNVQDINDEDILSADYVFISAMIIQQLSFQNIVNKCNQLGVPVVAGGPYPSSSYEKIEGVDYFVLDEAEITLPLFLHDMKNQQLKRIYTADQKPDIINTPIPRFDLLDMNSYSTMMLQYSRGCPFNCEFCDIIELFGRKPRTKSPQQFTAEMQALYESGYRGVLFVVDDNFIGNKRNVKQLLPEIIKFQEEKGFPFKLETEASINLAEDEILMDLMIKAGFAMVFLGIETPDEKALLAMQKKQNTNINVLDSIKKIQRKGMEVSAGFIIGFDNEQESIFERQIKFIQQSGIPMAMVGLLTALPKTQLQRRLEKEGRMLSDSSGNNTHSLKLNYIPTMDQKKLLQGYKNVLEEIYTPRNYFDRCLVLYKEMPKLSKHKRKISFSQILNGIRAFFVTFNTQLFSSYGIQYLKFLVKTLIQKPKLFAKAFQKAAMGHHFFKITDDIIRLDTFRSYLDQNLDLIRLEFEKINKISSPSSILKILHKHQSVMKITLKNLNYEKKKVFSKVENSFITTVENLKDYFSNFNDVIKQKYRDAMTNILFMKKNEVDRKEMVRIRKKIKEIKKIQSKVMSHLKGKYDNNFDQIGLFIHQFEKSISI